MTSDQIRRVIGYCRVSTDDRQAASLELQRASIERYAKEHGWAVQIVTERASGGSMDKRPVLDKALKQLGTHQADALLVAKLDRLSRSFIDFGAILKQAQDAGWLLVVLDPALDMSTPTGKAFAGMLAVFSEWERDMIRQRIRETLGAKKKADRSFRTGPRERLALYVPLIVKRRSDGASLGAIRKELRSLGVEVPPSTISRTLARRQVKEA